MIKRLNRRKALADAIGTDYVELGDYRYKPTRYVRIPVWAIGSRYYCVTRPGEAPPAADCREERLAVSWAPLGAGAYWIRTPGADVWIGKAE